ncbi:MAG: hypothetical protein LCH41_15060 [Armatimonadetes bacterium]|nr:hypothetical protein [Armatimonadota bacterium]
MRKLTLLSAVVAAVLLIPAMSFAQQGGRGGGQRGGMMSMMNNKNFLLMRNDVQKDLGLNDGQKASVKTAMESMQAKMAEVFQGMGGGGQGGGGGARPDFAAMQEKMEGIVKGFDTAAAEILDDKQEARLGEIDLQIAGTNALTREDVQKALGLKASQKRDIEDMQEAMNTANMEAMGRVRSGELTREEIAPIMEKNREALAVELGKILTAEQNEAFKKMKGAEFKRDPKDDEAMRNMFRMRRGG